MTLLKSLIPSKFIQGAVVEGHCPIYHAFQTMTSSQSPFALVVSQKRVLGIVQQQDYIDLFTSEDRISLISPIKLLMNEHFYFASPEYELEEAIRLMQKYQLRVLPIVEDEVFLGVFDYSTLLDCLAIQRSEMIRNLFAYITGFDNFELTKEETEMRDLIKN